MANENLYPPAQTVIDQANIKEYEELYRFL